jgi:hypothetical protein
VVRPDHETTVFHDWYPANPTIGRWRQTLHTPADDPSFDFSGESVQETDAAGTHSDTCWFAGSMFKKGGKISGGTWDVVKGNLWGDLAKPGFDDDYVGWLSAAVTYYRMPHGTPPHVSAPCVTRFPQQMTIKAPPDTSYNNYAGINGLGSDIGVTTVPSIRAGSSKTKTWP